MPRPWEFEELIRETSALDMTMHGDCYRRNVTATLLKLKMRDGRILPFNSDLEAALVDGGGWFVCCVLNAMHDEPLTLKEYERERAEEADEAARELADW